MLSNTTIALDMQPGNGSSLLAFYPLAPGFFTFQKLDRRDVVQQSLELKQARSVLEYLFVRENKPSKPLEPGHQPDHNLSLKFKSRKEARRPSRGPEFDSVTAGNAEVAV